MLEMQSGTDQYALLLGLALKSCGSGGAADQRESVCVVFVLKI